ncbi:MAG: hypothetical protein HC896_00960 [Bacteroidales bacterium]|nr:hypothetical protein [Bacteroidales bacterium]
MLDKKFQAASLNAEIAYEYTPIGFIGFGMAGFYDEVALKSAALKDNDVRKSYFGGIYLLHEFDYYPLIIQFHFGRYLGTIICLMAKSFLNALA